MILAEKYRGRWDLEFCGFEMILASLVRYKSERKCDHEMELMRGTFSTSPAVAFHFAFSSKSKIEFQKTPKVS